MIAYVQRQHEATARTMLAVEAAALSLLRGVARAATAGRSPIHAAKGLQAPFADAVARVQAAARRAARARFLAELEAVAPHIDGAPAIVVPEVRGTDDIDRLRAERAAVGLSSVYLAEAEKAAQERTVRVLAGSPKVQARIELDAATEVSVAFNDERLRTEQAMVKRYDGTRWLPFIGKQWNATNDRRTCPRCAGNDGKIRPLGLTFGGLTPGSVHPRCRCFGALVPAPLYLGRKELEAA